MQNKLEEKRKALKEIFIKAKNEEELPRLKEEIKQIFKTLNPVEISIVEQDLLKEGLTWRDIYRMCDVHFDLVKDIIVPSEELRNLPNGHPLSLLIWENTEILKDNEKLGIIFRFAKDEEGTLDDVVALLDKLYVGLKKHYMKNQFLIFPYLERRGVTAVSRVLWMKEDMLLARIKKLKARILELKKENSKLDEETKEEGNWIVNEVRDIVAREHNILYPTMYSIMREGEWLAVLNEMEKFGFYRENIPKGDWKPSETEPIYPWMLNERDLVGSELPNNIPKETLQMLKMAKADTYKLVRNEDIKLENGYLSIDEIDKILNHLPFEITYIDANMRTRYFNEPKGIRFFTRTKTILGRPVTLCHPPRSEELVHQVIDELKKGKDYEDFWINFMGRKLLIRFIAVRDSKGELRGILEVVQDITDLKNLEGEKRTLYI